MRAYKYSSAGQRGDGWSQAMDFQRNATSVKNKEGPQKHYSMPFGAVFNGDVTHQDIKVVRSSAHL